MSSRSLIPDLPANLLRMFPEIAQALPMLEEALMKEGVSFLPGRMDLYAIRFRDGSGEGKAYSLSWHWEEMEAFIAIKFSNISCPEEELGAMNVFTDGEWDFPDHFAFYPL